MADGEGIGRRVVDAILAGEGARVADLLAGDAVFHSPVTDYQGAERVTTVLGAAGAVVRDARATSVLERAGETVALFAAEVQGRPVQGVLRVVAGDDGRARDITLWVRPLKTLLVGIEEMKARLSAA